MKQRRTRSFQGFTRDSLEFLRAVRTSNSKEWFEDHREVYHSELVDPFQALVADLTATMAAIDPHFELRPALGRTISRIHRDVRFSKDKSRYRDVMWLTFKRPRKDWIDAPGYFFELGPSSYRFGMGYYAASRRTMDAFRARIDADPAGFLGVVAPVAAHPELELHGDLYRRARPSPHPPAIQHWYQRKSFYLACDRTVDERLLCADLVADLEGAFTAAVPLYRYLLALEDEKEPRAGGLR